jgi:hypothetical protein
LSSKSMNNVVISRAFWGHAKTHLPQPSHFPASITT